MKEFFKSLAAFQHEVPIIHKGTKGYSYSYADLAEIIEKITPILKKQNLGFYQQLLSERAHENYYLDKLKTVIFHTGSGESIESEVRLPFDSLEYVEVEKIGKDKKPYKTHIIRGFDGMNIPQAEGSLITYFRRYSLCCSLGLVSDVDSDARNKRLEPKELPTLSPENKKDWDNIVRVLATKQYTLEQVKTKWTVPEEHQERMNEDIKGYVPTKKLKVDEGL